LAGYFPRRRDEADSFEASFSYLLHPRFGVVQFARRFNCGLYSATHHGRAVGTSVSSIEKRGAVV